jgi:hypothetical protein
VVIDAQEDPEYTLTLFAAGVDVVLVRPVNTMLLIAGWFFGGGKGGYFTHPCLNQITAKLNPRSVCLHRSSVFIPQAADNVINLAPKIFRCQPQ